MQSCTYWAKSIAHMTFDVKAIKVTVSCSGKTHAKVLVLL
jgi:hypothetical protein